MLTHALVFLYSAGGWSELPMDIDGIAPYTERHRFVNEIGEEVCVYRLNDRGKEKAEWILFRRGHPPQTGQCGVAVQMRQWPKGALCDYTLDELSDAITCLAEATTPPIRQDDHPQGIWVRFIDFPATQAEFRKQIGWERHQAYGDPLSGPDCPTLLWLWEEVLVDYDAPQPYQEVLLWST